MAPTDLSPKDSASATKIVGEDEALCADVVTENGDNCLTVKVCNPEDIASDPDTNSNCGSISKKYRVITDYVVNEIDTASYETLFSYSGSGLFYGFMIEFDDDRIDVKLEIDGDTIFDLYLEDLDTFKWFDSGFEFCGITGFSGKGKKIAFQPKCPIRYATDVEVSAKAAVAGDDHLRSMYCLTKET